MEVNGRVLGQMDTMLTEKAKSFLLGGWKRRMENGHFYAESDGNRGACDALMALGLLTRYEGTTAGYYSFTRLGAEYVKGL